MSQPASLEALPEPSAFSLIPGTFNPSATLGAIEIGVLISTFLFGLVTAQTYVYVHRFPKDPKILRFLVPFVWFLELGHTICICHALYAITISQYGHPELLDIPPVSLDLAILLSGFIGPIVQGWFSHRIHKFSQRTLLPSLCLLLAFVRFAGSTALSVVAFHRLTLEAYIAHWSWLLTSILVVGAGTDVLLASALCFYLSRWRGAGFERTTRLVDRLMVWSIETGLLTSVGAVALLVCFLTMRDNFIWIGIFSVLARLFSNSFLASLNARPRLAQMYREEVARIDTSHSTSLRSPVSAFQYPILEMAAVRPYNGKSSLLPPSPRRFSQMQMMQEDVEKGITNGMSSLPRTSI